MVVPTKANYNLLLGKEWIHGIWTVPLTMHQQITIWKPDSIIENIEVVQSYFWEYVNHIDMNNFDRIFENISPCTPVRTRFYL